MRKDGFLRRRGTRWFAAALGAIAAGLTVALTMTFTSPVKADTIITAPWTKANSTEWRTGWMPPADGSYSGDFARAQALMYRLSDEAYDSDAGGYQGDLFKSSLKSDGFEVTGSRNGAVGDNSFAVRATKGSETVVNVIVWRGADDLMSVFGSFLGEPNIRRAADGNQYTVHEAYYYAADQAIQALKPAIASSCEGDDKVPLYLTGHNLGGAAAEVAGMLLAEQGCRVVGVTALGAPKPGLENFQQEYQRVAVDGVSLDARTNRFAAGHDPVPCLMPGRDWRQVGHSHYFDDQGNLHLNQEVNTCDTSAAFFKGIKDAAGLVGDWQAVSGFFHIANWLTAILAWLAGKLDLAADCSHTTFQGKRLGWWLGCRIVDLAQVAEFHTMDFNELFDSLLAALTSLNNKLVYLSRLENATWDPPKVVPLRIIVPKFDGEVLPTYVSDAVTSQFCWATEDPDTHEQVCDLQAPLGATMTLNFEGAIGNYIQSHGGGVLYDETTPGPGCRWVDRPDFILDQCQLTINETAPYTMRIKWQPFPS